jgi:hypothetical protein
MNFATNDVCPFIYSKQPSYDPDCEINQRYKTLPDQIRHRSEDSRSSHYPMQTSFRGPSTMKHLYTGIPNYYPMMKFKRPQGTMYDIDLSQFGPYGVRESYHYQVYPFHNRSVHEDRPYADYILPSPSILRWIKYPVIKEGTVEYLNPL